MKKWIFILLSAAIIFSLSACSGESISSEDENVSEPQEGTQELEDTEGVQQEGNGQEENAADSSDVSGGAAAGGEGVLVAYFSWSGNTEQVAQIIQQETGGELFKIDTAEPYTDDYDELLDMARQEQSDGARPELAGQVEDWDSYDIVFLGYPNWWNDAPMAVYTFLETHDFTGKTLIPFNTSSSGGFGRSLTGIEDSAPGADILEGLEITERELDDAQELVAAWLDNLGIR